MKFRTLVWSVALLALASGCAGGSSAVATVNGEEISADYMAGLRVSTGRALTVDTEEFRTELTQNIIRVAVAQAAATEFGITVSDDDVAQRIADPPPRWQPLFDQLAADSDTTAAYAESQAELSVLRDRVTAELMRAEDGFIEATLSETPQAVTSGCVRHILVATPLEATAALDRLGAGEDFAALAAELSLDVATGGGVVGGCPVEFDGFVAAFAAAAATAPLNDVVGPVETEFGLHLIRVEERTGPSSLEELRAEPSRFYSAATLSRFFTPWFNDVVRMADISVADAVGRWSPDGVGIVPPGQ